MLRWLWASAALLLFVAASDARGQEGGSPGESDAAPASEEGAAGDAPTGAQPLPSQPAGGAGTEPAAAPAADLEVDLGADVSDFYAEKVRHRLPSQLATVLDAALAVAGFDGARQALPELWRTLRDDPVLRAAYANLALQYKPRLDYSAYVGAIAQSSRYGGLAAGVEADLAAPLCRYLGGAFNGQLFSDKRSSGLAYDTRATGCLPWGPFALELGFTSQRSARVGLAETPSVATQRIDSLGFQLNLRGFRWLEREWELVVVPTEVNFVDVSPAVDDGLESAHFVLDAAFLRYLRYGIGPAGEDRLLEFLPVRVTGQQDAVGEVLSATVMDVGAVRVTGARLTRAVFFDGNLSFQQATIGPAVAGARREATIVTGAVDATVHWVTDELRSRLSYRRGLLPDATFRLLLEDRAQLGSARTRGDSTLGANLFAAYTRSVAEPMGVLALAAAATYGARLDYGYAIRGPLYLTVSAEAARSFYAGDDGLVLDRPTSEVRLSTGLAAVFSSSLGR